MSAVLALIGKRCVLRGPDRLLLGRFERSQALHQAALAASRVVAVQDTLANCLIERAERSPRGLTRGFQITLADLGTGRLDLGTRAADDQTIPNAPTLTDADTFDCRLVVSQRNFLPVQIAPRSYQIAVGLSRFENTEI
jgi:hypothetical protein